MTAVSTVTTSLAKSFVNGMSGGGGNTSPSPQGVKSMEAMEIDDNYLGHLSYGLELDDIENDLPNSTMVPNDHNLVSEGYRMQEDLPYRPVIELVPGTPTARKPGSAVTESGITAAHKLAVATTLASSHPEPAP